jgi:predicted metal-dependent TIM-barrel fold hydrolase
MIKSPDLNLDVKHRSHVGVEDNQKEEEDVIRIQVRFARERGYIVVVML